MGSTRLVASLVIVLLIGIAVIVRVRAHRPLMTEEIVRLTQRLEAQTGSEPKPPGFQLQPDGTWAPMQAGQTRKEP